MEAARSAVKHHRWRHSSPQFLHEIAAAVSKGSGASLFSATTHPPIGFIGRAHEPEARGVFPRYFWMITASTYEPIYRYVWTIFHAASLSTDLSQGDGAVEYRSNLETAYIRDVAMQLAEMARARGFKLLSFLLEMAALEANSATPTREQTKH
jgi:hypothetical protein